MSRCTFFCHPLAVHRFQGITTKFYSFKFENSQSIHFSYSVSNSFRIHFCVWFKLCILSYSCWLRWKFQSLLPFKNVHIPSKFPKKLKFFHHETRTKLNLSNIFVTTNIPPFCLLNKFQASYNSEANIFCC